MWLQGRQTSLVHHLSFLGDWMRGGEAFQIHENVDFSTQF